MKLFAAILFVCRGQFRALAVEDAGACEEASMDPSLLQAQQAQTTAEQAAVIARGRTPGSGRRRYGMFGDQHDYFETYESRLAAQEAQEAKNKAAAYPKPVTKMGINSGVEPEVTLSVLEQFAPNSEQNINKNLHNNRGARWLYNYQVVPSDLQIAYMNKYKVEFVPMLGFRKVEMRSSAWKPASFPGWCDPTFCKGYAIGDFGMLPRGFYTKCNDKTDDGYNICNGETRAANENYHMTTLMMVDLVGKVIDALEVRPRYFMGMNEPEDWHLPHKNYSPEEAEIMWSKFIQPLHSVYNLTLVSPTVNTPGWGGWTGDWFAAWLSACYANRNRTVFPCDVNLVGRISVHYYTCMASRWEQEYGFPHGNFYQKVAAQLATVAGTKDEWLRYLGDRPLWVTEFNCNNDKVKGNYCSDERLDCISWVLPSYEEQCERLTGQAQPQRKHGKFTIWGEGVVRWLEDAPNVERWAWWTIYGGNAPGIPPERQSAASLVNPVLSSPSWNPSRLHVASGIEVELKAHARALLMGVDIKGGCDFAHCPIVPCLNDVDAPWNETCRKYSDKCKTCPQCP